MGHIFQLLVMKVNENKKDLIFLTSHFNSTTSIIK